MTSVRITPTNEEKVMREGDLIVSKTDIKGRITYGNRTFNEFSGFKENELLGTQHNIIRHPDMPRAVFKLLWDRIQAGQEVFAFVKNICKDGSFYWVLANVTPSYDAQGTLLGYFSVRRNLTPGHCTNSTAVPNALQAEAQRRHARRHRGIHSVVDRHLGGQPNQLRRLRTGPAKRLKTPCFLSELGLTQSERDTSLLSFELLNFAACCIRDFGEFNHGGRDFFRSSRVAAGNVVHVAQVRVDLFHSGTLLLKGGGNALQHGVGLARALLDVGHVFVDSPAMLPPRLVAQGSTLRALALFKPTCTLSHTAISLPCHLHAQLQWRRSATTGWFCWRLFDHFRDLVDFRVVAMLLTTVTISSILRMLERTDSTDFLDWWLANSVFLDTSDTEVTV
jgi:PAS domain S-box-containing protein